MKKMIAVCMALFLLACSLPKPTLTIGEYTAKVELAVTDEERSRGLMYRDSLPDDGGMLFVFERPGPYSFWMKNTRIPLAIAFIDSNGIIVNVEEMSAYSEAPVFPRANILYALEMNSGWFAHKNIVPGMQVVFDERTAKYLQQMGR
jgi:uncharacterized membrane protein (UPF0127 family)